MQENSCLRDKEKKIEDEYIIVFTENGVEKWSWSIIS